MLETALSSLLVTQLRREHKNWLLRITRKSHDNYKLYLP
nr:MAG TPA: cell division cylcle protein 20 [Caudoviricetes sp.]